MDFFPVDTDEVGTVGDVVLQVAKDRVVFEQVGKRFRVGEVIDCNKFEVLIIDRGPQYVAADAAKAVDADLDCHSGPPGDECVGYDERKESPRKAKC